MRITIAGAGLAGCEAAWQISKFKIPVKLIDMKPERMTLAHKSLNFAELVCSNSLKAIKVENSSGLLKEEMRLLGSLIVEAGYKTAIPAGGALAVDRESFSSYITDKIKKNPYIEVENRYLTRIPEDDCTIIATGPLTGEELYDDIKMKLGSKEMSFFDAASPIVSMETINMDKAFKQSRYNKGSDDYINCPMEKDEYEKFVNRLINADTVPFRDFEDKKVFEGCMPIETMAKRGIDTIRFGPLKPVGLINPVTGKEPYSVVQLRQENKSASLYNLVGFQTRLTFTEQKNVFRMIPGLENAEFVRYGVMHRNTFINSPGLLNAAYQSRKFSNLFFAGQITGVEGYLESAASGIMAGINAALYVKKIDNKFILPDKTVIGALSSYISDENNKRFQPMNANFGIVKPLDIRIKNKMERYGEIAKRSLEIINEDLIKISEIRGNSN